MKKQHGFAGVVVAIGIGLILLLGGSAYYAFQQKSATKEYRDEVLGISLRYPASATLATSTLLGTTAISLSAKSVGTIVLFPYIESEGKIKPTKDQLDTILKQISENPALSAKNSTIYSIIDAHIPGFVGIKKTNPVCDIGFNLYKQSQPNMYLEVNGSIPAGNCEVNTAQTEKMFVDVVSSMQILTDTIGGIRVTTTLDSDQKVFDRVTVGTPLEGHILKKDDDYIFTDGDGGIDTVGYKQDRSHYTIYRGQDVPEKDYKNVIIVTAENPHFIEVDVNSELIQFKDQKLTIPDLKVVSM